MSQSPPSSKPIVFWNRAKKVEETENVYGGALVDWLYGTGTGQVLADKFLSKHWISKIYGAYQAASISQHKIKPFIRDFAIPMEQYEDPGFKSFNDFFIRKFKPGMRSFAQGSRMPAPAEARYLAWGRITPDQVFPVKGRFLSAQALLGDADVAREFEGGPLMIARLCPVDYHRFHYPDDGRVLKHYRVAGALHSVNPAALRYKDEVFSENERYVSILETAHFGKLAYIEVGAMCVGKIVQSHAWDQPFKRGDEKGYFLFGASTVIVLGQPGKWRPDADILERTARQQEVYIQLGDGIGQCLPAVSK